MRKVKKGDSEVVSTSSTASKNSTDRHKPPRFSLRRIFYIRRSRAKSFGSLDSESARSEFSVSVPSGRSEVSVGAPFDRVSISANLVASCDSSHLSVLNKSQRTQDSESSLTPSSGVLRECPLCLSESNIEKFPELTSCSHRSCIECFRQYLKIEITESRVNITCPECEEKLHPSDIEKILQDYSLTQKYESFMVRRVLVLDPDARWCPAPDCGYAVIASGCAGCPKLKCERPGCGTFFCYHCKQSWHPNQTCDAARRERSPNIRAGSISNSHETGSQKDDIKPCPRCGAFIVKMNDGSCNHMTCAVCGAEFCWLCMKEISDLHYLSPSGCTFWGKRPWSRKKKILWQLGTLVGAPIGITLIAGIAVPAMIIGIPVWVARKIYSRFQHSNKHKRNMAIAGGVAGSVLVSPVVAGLAVGIGVPILLAYVYGVVPISLCRSGGCGVSTKKSGVRFEFDEQENIGPSNPYTGDNQSVETTHHVANPSIAPSIGEASMGMTNSLSASGSNMDKIGVIRDESDRESASTRAVAGSSLNGSLCGSSYTGVSTYQNKLEVQVDISENQAMGKRNSFSSESANFSIGEKSVANYSIGEKSVTISYGDDASTKALAGSIAGYRDKDSISSAISHYECPSDIVSNASRSRQHSGGSLSGNEKPTHKFTTQGSPVLDCRSTVHFDEANVHSSKCRKCKKYSLSVGDKIHEQACSDVGYDESISSCPIVNNTTIKETEITDCNKTPCSVADVLCEDASCGTKLNKTVSLTEVETDRPSLNEECCSKNSGKLANKSLQKKKSLSHSFNSVYPRDSNNVRYGPQSPRFRRLSCELALEHGRLPLTETT